MTPKEKFEKIKCYDTRPIDLSDSQVKECEKIVDEFAIEFANWIRVCKLKQRPYDFDDVQQLLEIYKKEKSL